MPEDLDGSDFNRLIRLLSLDNAYEEFKSWDSDKGKNRLEIKKKILKLERQLEE